MMMSTCGRQESKHCGCVLGTIAGRSTTGSSTAATFSCEDADSRVTICARHAARRARARLRYQPLPRLRRVALCDGNARDDRGELFPEQIVAALHFPGAPCFPWTGRQLDDFEQVPVLDELILRTHRRTHGSAQGSAEGPGVGENAHPHLWHVLASSLNIRDQRLVRVCRVQDVDVLVAEQPDERSPVTGPSVDEWG